MLRLKVILFSLAAGLIVSAQAQAMVNGIDVSHWQGNINWNLVKNAGIEFAFAKATEGVDFVDSRYTQYMNGAIGAGVLIGPYHFARPNSGENDPLDAVKEADDFVDAIRPYYQQYPGKILRPVLDFEQLPNDPIPTSTKAFVSQWIRDFNGRVENRLGFAPLIYTSSNYARNYFETNINQYDLWLANWNYTPPNTPPASQLGIWEDWAFWQYTSTGSVAGISGNVDRDIFGGSLSDLLEYVPGLLPGDYNNDGRVDAADYGVWRDNIGAPAGTLPNDSNGGVIGQPQYESWRVRFGAAGNSAIFNTAVPEPSSVLVALGFGLATLCRHRRTVR